MNPILGMFLFVMLAPLALASFAFIAVWVTLLFSSKGKSRLAKNPPRRRYPGGCCGGGAVKHIETFEELDEYLQDLNYEHGQDATAIRAEGQGRSFYFAFCTDPAGEWFLETGDPRERLFEEDDYPIYVPLGLGHVSTMAPYAIFEQAAE